MREELRWWIGSLAWGVMIACILVILVCAILRCVGPLLPAPDWREIASPVESHRCFKRGADLRCFEVER